MTSRDPDQLLGLFLEEGPAVLPDRVLETVRDDIHRQGQRTVVGPWRFMTMRTLLSAAAVIAAVAIGGGVLLATRTPSEPSFGTTPRPSPIATAAANAAGHLTAGSTYDARNFISPFRLSVPEAAGAGGLDADLTLGDQVLRLRPPSGGAITIHAQDTLPNDLCHPTGVIHDTPAGVNAWLNASAPDMTISQETQVHVGLARSISYWDIRLGRKCYSGGAAPHGNPTIWFQAGEHHRVYEVNVSPQLRLLVFTWGAGYGGQGDNVLDSINTLTNELVKLFSPIPSN
jgi:hypothetical protein